MFLISQLLVFFQCNNNALALKEVIFSTDTCMCSSANLGTSLQLCSGASLSPCGCMGSVCTVSISTIIIHNVQ